MDNYFFLNLKYFLRNSEMLLIILIYHPFRKFCKMTEHQANVKKFGCLSPGFIGTSSEFLVCEDAKLQNFRRALFSFVTFLLGGQKKSKSLNAKSRNSGSPVISILIQYQDSI